MRQFPGRAFLSLQPTVTRAFLSHQHTDAPAFGFLAAQGWRLQFCCYLLLAVTGLPVSSALELPLPSSISFSFQPSHLLPPSQLSTARHLFSLSHLFFSSPIRCFVSPGRCSFSYTRMDKRHRVPRSDSSELDIPLRPKESRKNELPPASTSKRVRATTSPVTPFKRHPLFMNASAGGSTRGYGKRHSEHGIGRRVSPIPFKLPSGNPHESYRRTSSEFRGLVIPPDLDDTSLGISLWAYLIPLLPPNTRRPRKFTFMDLQSTVVKRELPDPWKTHLVSGRPNQQVLTIIAIYLCGSVPDQRRCEPCMGNTRYFTPTDSAGNAVLSFPRCVLGSDGDLSELEEALGLGNGAAKTLCCNRLYQAFLAGKERRRSHLISSSGPVATNGKPQGEEAQPSPGIPVRGSGFSSDTSEERFENKLKKLAEDAGADTDEWVDPNGTEPKSTTPASLRRSTRASQKRDETTVLGSPLGLRTPVTGPTVTKARTGSSKRTHVSQKQEPARVGSRFAPIDIGNSSDSCSGPQAQPRHQERPPAIADNPGNQLTPVTPSPPIMQQRMEIWEIAPGCIRVGDDLQSDGKSFFPCFTHIPFTTYRYLAPIPFYTYLCYFSYL